jgi:hypothetical protein
MLPNQDRKWSEKLVIKMNGIKLVTFKFTVATNVNIGKILSKISHTQIKISNFSLSETKKWDWNLISHTL